jgi:hypothetical protein
MTGFAASSQLKGGLTLANITSVVALLLIVTVLVYPATVLADDAGGTAAEGMVAGQADGRTDTSSILWLGAGCLIPGQWRVD